MNKGTFRKKGLVLVGLLTVAGSVIIGGWLYSKDNANKFKELEVATREKVDVAKNEYLHREYKFFAKKREAEKEEAEKEIKKMINSADSVDEIEKVFEKIEESQALIGNAKELKKKAEKKLETKKVEEAKKIAEKTYAKQNKNSSGSTGKKVQSRGSVLGNMPNKLKKWFKGNVIVSPQTRPSNWAAGWVNGDGNVYLYNESYKNDHYVMYHEVAHVMDFELGAHKDPRWKEIYQKEWVNRGVYGSTYIMEAFAEGVAGYFGYGGSATNISDKPLTRQYIAEAFGDKSPTTEQIRAFHARANVSSLTYGTTPHIEVVEKNTPVYNSINSGQAGTAKMGDKVTAFATATQNGKRYTQIKLNGKFVWIADDVLASESWWNSPHHPRNKKSNTTIGNKPTQNNGNTNGGNNTNTNKGNGNTSSKPKQNKSNGVLFYERNSDPITLKKDFKYYDAINGKEIGTFGVGTKLSVDATGAQPLKARDGSGNTYYWIRVSNGGSKVWIESQMTYFE